MKKQLIKEAFRLQQIAGLRPINEIFDEPMQVSAEQILRDFQSVGINPEEQIAWEKAYGMDLTQHVGSARELAAEIAEETGDDLEYEFFSSPEDLEYQEFNPEDQTAAGYTPVAAVQVEDSISYLIGKK